MVMVMTLSSFYVTASLIEVDGADPVPVPFRYEVAALETGRTHVYVPNGLGDDADRMAMRPQTLGAVVANNFHKVWRGRNARVVWEAYLVEFSFRACKFLVRP